MQLPQMTRRTRRTTTTLVILVVLLSAVATGKHKHNHRDSEESDEDEDHNEPLEAFADFVLKSLRNNVMDEDLQPFPLPNAKREFRVLGFKWPGSGRLHDGAVLSGLETAERELDAPVRLTTIKPGIFPRRHRSSSASRRQFHRLSFEFKIHDFVIGSNATLKIGLASVHHVFEASSERLTVGVDMLISFADHQAHSGNQQADVVHARHVMLGEVKILDYEPFKFELKSGGWLFWGKKVAAAVVGKLFKSTIISSVEEVLDELLSWVIKKVTKSLSAMLLEFL